MALDFDSCYRALQARDERFDGRFFTGVTSTGIYCRPICPARTPARRNVRFFPHPGAAEAAGFRACRRCRPETSPGSPDWNARADLTGRAVRLIADGYVDAHGVTGLAGRLHVTARHLSRVLTAELGAGPLALARTTRLQTARRLLAETPLPVTDIAFASGFASVRQFNDSFLAAYGSPPSALRARPLRLATDADGSGAWLTLRLARRGPFDGTALARFLSARAIAGVEEIAGRVYRRTIRSPGGPGLIELTLPADSSNEPVVLRTRLASVRGVGQVVARCRQLLDLDADPAAISSALAADPALAPLARRHPGLRVPGCYDGFEQAVRAVLGQRVSVAAARVLAGRLAARLGTPVSPEPSGARAPGPAAGVPHAGQASPASAAAAETSPGQAWRAVLFPAAETLADADLAGLGLTRARQDTLRALATAVAGGALALDGGADPAETRAGLLELPGVGPWTAEYVAMRAGRDPDAFPATDLGLRRAMTRLGCEPGHDRRWRPWRAYAAQHLWTQDAKDPPTAASLNAAAPRDAAAPLDTVNSLEGAFS